MSRTERSSAPGGFTLLEVLVAMVLLSIGVLGLQALSVTAIRANAQARVQTTQSAALTEVMEGALYRLRFGMAPGDITPGTTCSTDELGDTCITVTQVAALSSATQAVYSVEASLTPEEGAQPLSMTSVIYVPIAPGGGGGQTTGEGS